MNGRLNIRRLAVLGAAIAAIAGLVLVGRPADADRTPVFTQLGDVRPPFVPLGDQITGSWFCPGAERVSGGGPQVVMANTTSEMVTVSLTVMTNDRSAKPVTARKDIAPYAAASVSLVALQPAGSFVSALVEVPGGGGQVEQKVVDPAGDSVVGCSNAASATWYFADGFTQANSSDLLAITNPAPGLAIVDVELATGSQSLKPSALQGLPIPAKSVTVVRVQDYLKNEPVVAASITATRGRVVAVRSAHFRGSGRAGASVTLGAPALSDQFYFVDQEIAAGTTTRLSIYNPGTDPLTALVVPVGDAATASTLPDDDVTFTVEGGTVRSITLSSASGSTIKGLPSGHFAIAVSSPEADAPPFVVEQAVTRTSGNDTLTSVVMGTPGGVLAQRWAAVVVPDGDLSGAFRVLNAYSTDDTIAVYALGPSGYVVVPGMDKIALRGNSVVSLNFASLPPELVGQPVWIQSGQRLFVERFMPAGHGIGVRSLSVPLGT